MHARNAVRSIEKSLTLADSPYTVLPYIYNVIKVNTAGGNVRVNLPTVDYPIDVIKTSSDAYIVTIWVSGTQIGEVAGELSVVTIENAEVTKDEPWYPYDAIVGIAGVSGDGGEVLAKDRFGRVIAGGRGVAGTDDATVIQTAISGIVNGQHLVIHGALSLSSGITFLDLSRVVIDIDAVTPDASIGDAITIDNVNDSTFNVSINGGGQYAGTPDDAIYLKRGINLQLNINANDFGGIVVHDIPNRDLYESYGHIYNTFHTRNCVQSLFIEGNVLNPQGGSADIIDAWWFGDTKSNVIQGVYDLCIRKIETLYHGSDPNLVLNGVVGMHADTIALGEGACTLLDMIGVFYSEIKNLFLVRPFVGLHMTQCGGLDIHARAVGPGNGDDNIAVVVEGGVGSTLFTDGIINSYIHINSYGMDNVIELNNTYRTHVTGQIGSNKKTAITLNQYSRNIYISDAIITDNNLSANITIPHIKSYTVYPVVFENCEIVGQYGNYLIDLEVANQTNIMPSCIIAAIGIPAYRNKPRMTNLSGLSKKGSSTGTGSEDPIPHGLAAIPVGCKAWIKIEYPIGSGRYITKDIPYDATNVYPTVDNGVAFEWGIA
jgi:hypothetical protein